MTRWCQLPVALLLLLLGSASAGQPPLSRYRVEQIVRLETTSAQAQPLPGRLRADPVTTVVEGRVRLVLEQRAAGEGAGQSSWRCAQVEIEGPRTEPAAAGSADVERALALGLGWMQQLDGQEFAGALADLPVLPLGEAAPAWLTSWLRWAQTGSYSSPDQDPVFSPAANYELEWLRSESRQRLCHVQRARWTLPVTPAPGSLPASLVAEGVEAYTHFAAQSLEWVAQDDPVLVYAERSGVRETFWSLGKVKKPELRELVFRLRLGVEVRLERLP